MQQFDLIIVGGGLVGAGLAIALQDSQLKIALIDARKPSNEDPRLFALNESSCQFLKNLNLWQALESYAAPIEKVHVSWEKHFGAVRLKSEEVGLASLGHVIPAKQIELVLNERLASLANVTLFRPAILANLTHAENVATLQIKQDERTFYLQTPLVIGVDGTESTVRKEAHIEVERVEYGQCALVTRTLLQRSHHHVAYERFTKDGVLAMLPLKTVKNPDNECATIWTANKDKINDLLQLSEADFLTALQNEFGYRLGRLLGITKRHVFPLQKVKVTSTLPACILLLGNAAHTMSPVAAQGFNLAIYEVAALVDCLQDGQFDLTAFQRKISQQETSSMSLSHHLSTLFDKPIPPFVLSAGMVALDVMTPFKKHFIKQFIGRAGSVPRLLLSMDA